MFCVPNTAEHLMPAVLRSLLQPQQGAVPTQPHVPTLPSPQSVRHALQPRPTMRPTAQQAAKAPAPVLQLLLPDALLLPSNSTRCYLPLLLLNLSCIHQDVLRLHSRSCRTMFNPSTHTERCRTIGCLLPQQNRRSGKRGPCQAPHCIAHIRDMRIGQLITH